MHDLRHGILNKLREAESKKMWLPGAGRRGKWGDAGQKVQTFSYEMNKFWGSHVQFWGANAYSQCYTEYLKAAVRLEL